MLGIVNSFSGIRRRRPAEPSGGCRLRPSRQLGKVRKPALGGPDCLQSIEGRHAWPGLTEVETWIGEANPLFGRASRKCQGETLRVEPAGIRGESAADLLARCVEQDRLLNDLAREHLLREARHQHRVEAQPPRRRNWPDEDLAIALRRRHGGLQHEAFENDQNFAQGHRTDGSHRGQFGQNGEYPVGLSEGTCGERAEPVEPLAPIGVAWQTVEIVNERKGEAGESREIIKRSRQRRRPRLILSGQLCES